MIHYVKPATWWGCCTHKKNTTTLSRGRCVDETWVTLVVLNAQLNVRHVMRVRCVDGDKSHRSCCMHN
jgi:hypothetical protein